MRLEVSVASACAGLLLSRIYNSTAWFWFLGTEEENKSIVQTVINTAANRSKAMAFNYASLALNNSFFLDMLVCPSLRRLIHSFHIPLGTTATTGDIS